MEINKAAPAVATHELLIKASVQKIWSLVAEIDRWPNWNPAVKRLRRRARYTFLIHSAVGWVGKPSDVQDDLTNAGFIPSPRKATTRRKTSADANQRGGNHQPSLQNANVAFGSSALPQQLLLKRIGHNLTP